MEEATGCVAKAPGDLWPWGALDVSWQGSHGWAELAWSLPGLREGEAQAFPVSPCAPTQQTHTARTPGPQQH